MALEIQLATGVYHVVQGTFRLQGGDLKMQFALGVQDTTLKSRNRNILLNHIRKCLMFALNLMQFCLAHDDIECITRTVRGGHDKIPKGPVRANHAPPKGSS